MNLKHLETFLIVSELQSFTKAAAYLHYAQSNITTQIQQLEKELHVHLFERMGKQISLTAAGIELVPYAVKMIELSKTIQKKFTREEMGHIRIAASESICLYRLPEIISAFQATHPSIELFVNVLQTVDYLPLLTANTIDLVFTLDIPLHHPDIRTLYSSKESIYVCCCKDHPFAQAEVTIQDFEDARMVLTGKDCSYRQLFEKDLLAYGVHPNVVLETSSVEIIKQMVCSGLGIGFLPQMVIQKELHDKKLVNIQYPIQYEMTSQVIHHKDKWISPVLQDFITLIKAKLGNDEV